MNYLIKNTQQSRNRLIKIYPPTKDYLIYNPTDDYFRVEIYNKKIVSFSGGWRTTYYINGILDQKTFGPIKESTIEEIESIMKKDSENIYIQTYGNKAVAEMINAKLAEVFGVKPLTEDSIDRGIRDDGVELCFAYAPYSTISYSPAYFYHNEKYKKLSIDELMTMKPAKPEYFTIQLNNSHSATVYKDRIVVGCQTFDIDIIAKLQEAWEKVK